MDIVLVAAIAENGVIGRGNALPWRLKSDMQHFRALTMGKPVIMGRKTYLSIGKPLAGRTTIVVSRDPDFAAPGFWWRRASMPLSRRRAATRCGATPMRSSLPAAPRFTPRRCPQATRLVITWVHKPVEGDARFPPIDPKSGAKPPARSSGREPKTRLLSRLSPTNVRPR